MIKLVRSLVPENGMDFGSILSFETKNYIGMWNYQEDRYVLIAKNDCELRLYHLSNCDTLDKLDDLVYQKCEERIIGVSDVCNYTISLDN